jgi:hypothetical protein
VILCTALHSEPISRFRNLIGLVEKTNGPNTRFPSTDNNTKHTHGVNTNMLYKHTTQKLCICDPQTQLNNFFTLVIVLWSGRSDSYDEKINIFERSNFMCILYAFYVNNFLCILCNPNVKSCVFKKNFLSIVYNR